jgi:hypothetical protein
MAAVLAVITAALYPTTQESPTPVYAQLVVASLRPVELIQYSVYQVSPAIAKMDILVQLPSGAAVPPAGTPVADLIISPPIGISFTTCPPHVCESENNSISSWKTSLTFFQSTSGLATAFADFYVRARSYGETYNGVNAAAAVPEVTYSGSGTPVFQTQYQIPHASSYDWSSFPVQFANATFATWTQPMTGGQLAGRDAVGLDYANQSRDGYYTFLAGAILGLAGGAVLSAFQEALHANDRK